MNNQKLKTLNFAVLIASTLTVLGFLLYMGGGIELFTDATSLKFLFWSLLPFLLLISVAYLAQSTRTLQITFFSSALCGLSIYFYFESFFIYADAQGALVFLFLPIYQLIGISLIFGLLKIFSLIRE